MEVEICIFNFQNEMPRAVQLDLNKGVLVSDGQLPPSWVIIESPYPCIFTTSCSPWKYIIDAVATCFKSMLLHPAIWARLVPLGTGTGNEIFVKD